MIVSHVVPNYRLAKNRIYSVAYLMYGLFFCCRILSLSCSRDGEEATGNSALDSEEVGVIKENTAPNLEEVGVVSGQTSQTPSSWLDRYSSLSEEQLSSSFIATQDFLVILGDIQECTYYSEAIG